MQHLVLAAPTVLQSHVQVLLCLHQPARLLQRLHRLTVQGDHPSLLQLRTHLRNQLCEVVVAQREEVVKGGLLVGHKVAPRCKHDPLLFGLADVELIDNRVVLQCLPLVVGHSDCLCASGEHCAQEDASGLFCEEDAIERRGVEQEEGKHVPADGSDGPVLLLEVVLVNIFEGGRLSVDLKHVFALLLLEVLLLGILAAFVELLIVLDQTRDYLVRPQFLLHLLDFLGLQLLGLLNGEDLLIVIGLVAIVVLLFLLRLLEIPLDGREEVVADLELRVEGVLGDGVEGDGCLAPVELSE